VAASAAIVAAVGAGELAPSEAVDLAKVIDIYLHALATGAFEERLAKLESAAEQGPAPAATSRTPIALMGGSNG
jgi:hypothetical protein